MGLWTLPLIGWKFNPVLFIIFVATVILFKLLTRKKYVLPPGPLALPIIGNLFQLYCMKDKLFKDFASTWVKRYGPIFTVYIGPKRMVVLNNIDLALEATVKKQTEFAGRPHFASFERMSDGYKDIIMADYGPTWRLHRKIAFQAMKNYLSGEKLERALHESFRKFLPILSEVEGPVNHLHYLSLLIYNFICHFCWGQSYDMHDNEFKLFMESSDEINELFGNGTPEDIIPILRYVPSKKRNRIIELLHLLQGIIRRKFKDHKATFDSNNIRDFIDDLLLAQETLKAESPDLMDQLTDTHFTQTIFDIFGAGTDTSRFTLHWAIYYMAMYPDVQKRIQEEIDRVTGGQRLPSLADRDKLAYTEGTLHEIMRIDTIVPIGLPHCAMVDSTLGGYDIPKGTMVLFNIWGIHMDKNYWESPERFEPTRFLDPDGTLAPKPVSFFPFSAGRRNCLGESIAKPELLLLFACIMQYFTISKPINCSMDKTLLPGPANVLIKDVKVLITRRVTT